MPRFHCFLYANPFGPPPPGLPTFHYYGNTAKKFFLPLSVQRETNFSVSLEFFYFVPLKRSSFHGDEQTLIGMLTAAAAAAAAAEFYCRGIKSFGPSGNWRHSYRFSNLTFFPNGRHKSFAEAPAAHKSKFNARDGADRIGKHVPFSGDGSRAAPLSRTRNSTVQDD